MGYTNERKKNWKNILCVSERMRMNADTIRPIKLFRDNFCVKAPTCMYAISHLVCGMFALRHTITKFILTTIHLCR